MYCVEICCAISRADWNPSSCGDQAAQFFAADGELSVPLMKASMAMAIPKSTTITM